MGPGYRGDVIEDVLVDACSKFGGEGCEEAWFGGVVGFDGVEVGFVGYGFALAWGES